MGRLLVLSLLCLALLGWEGGCAAAPPNTPEPLTSQLETQPTSPTANPKLTNTIGGILKSPADFNGKSVEVVGYFRGWDLLGEAGGPPPVTRSDWVIADNSGAIYVTGRLPEGLDPAAQDDLQAVVRLEAIVVVSRNTAYLETQSVEVISGQ